MESLKLSDPGFTLTLQEMFKTQCEKGIEAVLPYVIALIIALGTIQIALSALRNIGEEDPLKILVKNIFKIGVIMLLVKHWGYICDVIKNSAVWFGMKAGGLDFNADVKKISDSSFIFERGCTVCADVFESILRVSGNSVSATLSAILLKIGLILVIFLSFVFIGLQVFLTIVEFNLIKVVTVVMLPFGLIPQTRFLCEKAIGAIWSFAIKLLMLYFLLSFSFSIIESWQSIDASSTASILRALCGCLVLAYLIWQAPSMAQGLLSGTPSLDAGHAAGAAMRGAGRVAGAVAGGAALAGATYQAAKMPGPNGQIGMRQFGRNLATIANQSLNPFTRGRTDAQNKIQLGDNLQRSSGNFRPKEHED